MDKIEKRHSGIELLRIFAILIIVVSHVSQTLLSPDKFNNLGFANGFFELSATTDFNAFILIFLYCMAFIGNLIFVVIFSYFSTDAEYSNKKKVIKLASNTIIISLLFLITYLLFNININNKLIIKSLFPIFFHNNWFITAFLLFMLIVPYLNIIIKKLDQKKLFRITFVLFVLYFMISFIESSFFISKPIIFITVYFVVNYIKRYKENFWNKKKNCIILILISFTLLILILFLANLLGINVDNYRLKIKNLLVNNNPFALIIAISLFYLFKNLSFKSKIINSIASLSLFIYLIHENILFRTYTRVQIWHFIYVEFGYSYLFVEVFIYSICLFIASIIVSYIYKYTIGKIVDILIEKYYPKLKNIVNKVENKILKLNE